MWRLCVVLKISYASPIVINNKIVDTSIEKLLAYRPVTLRNEKERAIFKIQEGICRGFRRCLEKNNFTEIHTPKIVSEGAEGGANIFQLNYFGKFYKNMGFLVVSEEEQPVSDYFEKYYNMELIKK